ncbi:MAG: efflux RND transporter periplasmic adaptor subunit [Burkholderiaceae bacterium]
MQIRQITIAIFLMSWQHVWAAPVACLIEPEKVAEVGASSIGIIEKIVLERGDHVRKGQVIAYLKSRVERASVDVASARAQAQAELKASIAAHELALSKLSRARELSAIGFVSKDALEQAIGDEQITKNHVLQAKEAQTIAQQELELSNSQLAQRSIRSPFSGIIIDRYRTEGERVEREPIFRIAQINPLRVEVMLPVSQFGQIKPGATVNIKAEVAGMQELVAKVVLIDSVVDAASNTFRVRLTLPNPDYRIPAGLRCKADFDTLPKLDALSPSQQKDDVKTRDEPKPTAQKVPNTSATNSVNLGKS